MVCWETSGLLEDLLDLLSSSLMTQEMLRMLLERLMACKSAVIILVLVSDQVNIRWSELELY